MIRIITDTVKMPNIRERRFQHSFVEDKNSIRWIIIDTTQNRIIYTGNFEESCLICHNLNKKFYMELTEKAL
jgi:hypothetical protein